jgi:PAS domain S-box-containing protein
VIVVDIDSDPLWDDYRHLAQAHGLRACWSTPITDARGAVLGTFAMYYREPRSPAAEDLRLIARATRLAGLAIQRQKAREALRANEARLLQEKRFVDTLMDSLPGIVLLFDVRGGLVKWNKVLERVTGYSTYDLAAMSAFDLVSPTEVDAVEAAVLAARDGGQPSVEAHVITRNGHAIPYYFTGVRLMMEGGPHTLGIGIDVSERRRLEEQFQQAQKMEAMGHLAAGVAHDFNNLLTVISGHAQVLGMDPSVESHQQESVEAIRDAGKRAAALTRQLLSFSRKTVLQPRVLDLNAEVSETKKMLERVIGEEIRLTTVLATDLRAIEVDPGQLSQVLMNLTVNARDAMPRGGVLTVSTRNVDLDEAYCGHHSNATPGRYVALSVSDTGSGIAPEIRARIFEPFFTTKGAGKGTGLGLAMVFGAVTQSGGHIEVASEVGRGTTFEIYFPAVDAEPMVLDRSGDLDSNSVGSETILLVEDEPAVRALSQRALRSRGYTVLVATDGTDALRLSDEHRGAIDLVVTDVVMAGLSGRETVEALRQRRAAVRALYVSGYTDDEILRHGVLENEVQFLPKPFTPLELARKVREILDVRTNGAPSSRS